MSNERRASDAAVIRSVDRAIAILDLLAQDGWRAGAEVARELGVHRSTALRLLGTLERHALVERDPRTSKYRLGRRLAQLGSLVSGEFDLRHVARPVCEALSTKTGETVTLDVLDGDEIVPIEQATATTAIVSVDWLGHRVPVHCTASGKVIMAFGLRTHLRRAGAGSRCDCRADPLGGWRGRGGDRHLGAFAPAAGSGARADPPDP